MGDQCYIKGDIQLVSKYLVSGQRRKWGSKLLGDVILEYLDLCAYSNNDLSRIFKADKSTISRKMQQLKYYDLVKPVFTGGPDRIYYITNCENCPWDLTIEECRDKSITTLQKIFKERYNIKLEKSTFSDIKDNHTLKHVSEVYRETSSQSYIEMEKQKLMDRLMTNITNSFKNRNRGRNSKNKDSSLGLPLPRTLDH
jgi:DNA-binding transcriptional regulator GbsR (MarR family)